MQNFEYTHLEEITQRLDVLLSTLLGHSRSHIQRSIKNGEVMVNSQVIKKTGFPISKNDFISALLTHPDQPVSHLVPMDLSLEVLFEDENVVVINKPAGLSVHPSSSEKANTLVNALVHRYGKNLSDLNNSEVPRPGIVHRLDKDTTGLMLVARNNFSHRNLAKQLSERTLKRTYWALVVGNFKENSGQIETMVGRHPKDRKRMAVLEDNSKSSRNALTYWRLLDEVKGYSLLELKLQTGRTHQIRVHLDYINHPILGDQIYGGQRNKSHLIKRQCLHSKEISFVHPVSGKEISLCSKLPEDIRFAALKLGFSENSLD
jgi:23S rRNA pseudouridine1911/1915/1917 synthase